MSDDLKVTLWVANATKQKWCFTYRVKNQQQQRMHLIKGGEQIRLDHLTGPESDQVIEQNVRYGMRHASETGRPGFSGLVYKVGGDPINVERLLETFARNDEVRDAEAEDRLMKGAIALSDNIANTIHRNTGADKERVRPSRVELETIEVTDGKPTISKGVEVVRPGAVPQRARAS